MNRQRRNALILTPRIFPGHQIASLLELHGWSSVHVHNTMSLYDIMQQHPGMLVVDVTREQACNFDLLDHYRRSNLLTYRVALCEGGNTRAMRVARHIGVDGFFYLNRHGLAIDASRGLAPIFLRQRHTRTHHMNMPRPAMRSMSTALP